MLKAQSSSDSITYDGIRLGDGYNQFTQQVSSENFELSDAFNVQTFLVKGDVDIDILQKENLETSSRHVDASLGLKLFPLSAAFKSHRDNKKNTSLKVHRGVVITRHESAKLKKDFEWSNDKIDQYGTSFFSDVHYGGIIEIEVETRSDDAIKQLDLNGGAHVERLKVKLAEAGAGYNSTSGTNDNRTTFKCRYYGGSISKIPTTTEEINAAIIEFSKSVSADSMTVVKRATLPFSTNIARVVGCCSYIHAKREECLALTGYTPNEMKKLLHELTNIEGRIKMNLISDVAEVKRLFSMAKNRYQSIASGVDTRPQEGIIMIGNARVGKSRLLSTPQTDFDPKFAAKGADTLIASQQIFVSPDGPLGLIDTPGLYEVDQEKLEANIREITNGVHLAKHMKVCLVGRANSGNIQTQDHAVIGRIAQCLSSLSYDNGLVAAPKGGPVYVTLIINHVSEWELDQYTEENINIIFGSIRDSIKTFGGVLFLEQVILVISMDPAVLSQKTEKFIEFINDNARSNELKFRVPLQATKDDVPMLTKVLAAGGASVIGFGGGLAAGTLVDVAMISVSGLGPIMAFGVVTVAGTALIYAGAMKVLKARKSKRAMSRVAEDKKSISVYVLTKDDEEPVLCNGSS